MSEPLRIVVTGASRGLGLELCKQWLEAGQRVFALARDPEASNGLMALRESHPGALGVATCDVVDDRSVERAALDVEQAWGGCDWLINNAGVAGPWVSKLGSLDHDEIRRMFEVNTLGPLRVSHAFLPRMLHGREPRIVHVTSRMGSIADNTSGGAWGYRMSKAALNMAGANMALELKEHGIATMLLHPGWVKTDMGGAGAALEVAEACAGMRRVIEALTLADTGCFRDHSGATLPW